jgi:hypothetical protein
MKKLALEHTHLENNKLGAKYCRKSMEKEGVSIFVQKT